MNYKNYFKQRLIEAVSSPEEIQAHQRRRLDRLAAQVGDQYVQANTQVGLGANLNAFDRIGKLYQKAGFKNQPSVETFQAYPGPVMGNPTPITDPEELAKTKERATSELKRLRGTNPSLGQRIKRAVSTMLGTSSHY